MISYYSGDPKRIQHFTKVHSYAKLIGEREQLSPEELYILEAAAYTHDIGIKPAEEKYGSSAGKLQEQEGPAVARGMLMRLGFAENVIERVCYLIGHHHTYTGIEGRDYQILVEADFLVNLYEDGRPDGDGGFMPDKAAVETAYQFEELGYEVTVCELSKEDDLDAKLARYIGQPYRLILDFNSLLPRMVLDDGTPYVDRLAGPFFDYILDHPLFHYQGLSSGVKNLHAIVLDEAQQKYVEKYYEKVASVHMLPLGATRAVYEGTKEPECRILFPGTYDRPDAVYQIVENAPEPLGSTMKDLIERRLADPTLLMEEAFSQHLKEEELELPAGQFALFMNSMYAVDAYVRDYFRKAALDALLAEKLPVTVFGEGWEKYSCGDEHSLRREPAVPFALSFERIAKAHVLLNVSPIFNRGMHDRVPAGMANHAVVLTDENPYLRRTFTDGKELLFYSLEKPDTLCEQAERTLTDVRLREKIAASAYETFEREYTWKRRAEQILAFAEEVEA